ncbi:MAG: VOC family protein [Alphaproteobacteria bacterium]
MARLRHIAVVVKDPEKSAVFYEQAFGMKRVGDVDADFASGVYLSDGEINLALLKYKGARGSGLKDAESFVGTHHFGFQVDDLEETGKAIEASGGSFFFDLGSAQHANFERKFKDPDGVIFDISKNGWVGTPGKK